MSALKWCLLALTALLSSQSCSANRATTFSEWVDPWPDDHVALSPRPAPPPYPPIHLSPRPQPVPPPGPVPASAPIPDIKNGAKDSDVSTNWCGTGSGRPGVGCGGGAPPCVPQPPKNPYYCRPARCTAYPGCEAGAGGGFTIYMDDHFIAGVSSSGNEH